MFHLKGPRRIVCLTGETVDTLYRLGEAGRIVGITGFATNPPQARKEKPRIAAYTHAKLDRILNLKPDLVLCYSDLQADIARELIQAGLEVYIFNQRSIEGIFKMIHRLSCLVEAKDQGYRLICELQRTLEAAQKSAQTKSKPKVYFEEWPEPYICAIQWVSQLIEIAGGNDIFAERSLQPMAKARIIEHDQMILAKQPEIIIGSWCGRRFRVEQVCNRPGWGNTPAVQNQRVHEIKSAYLLQPGPTAITIGLQQIQQLIHGLS